MTVNKRNQDRTGQLSTHNILLCYDDFIHKTGSTLN